MRSITHTVIGLILVLGLAAVANAEDTEKATAKEAPAELKNQTHCPVMGGKIDSTVFTDIQGQRVYHCCPMCSDKLTADPDKFFGQAAEEGILFENIQTTCPVSGEELEDKLVYVDYEGRRIAFCCPKCVSTFNDDPATFLGKLDEGSEDVTEKEDKKEAMDHSGHKH
jgi:YHS domain-containing protein